MVDCIKGFSGVTDPLKRIAGMAATHGLELRGAGNARAGALTVPDLTGTWSDLWETVGSLASAPVMAGPTDLPEWAAVHGGFARQFGQQQIVTKSIGKDMQSMPGIADGAIMPDGPVGLIPDPSGLVKLTQAGAATRAASRT